MKIGAVFPQLEIGKDMAVIREFGERVDALGYDHIVAYDHVVGVDRDREGGWGGYYDRDDQFHEPLTLFAYLANCTDSVEFVTGVLVLPQRQTTLVAKQAAEIDVLSGGRVRLGASVGWNPLEYVSLGMTFEERGRRLTEQIRVLRDLWTNEVVRFDGEFDDHVLRDVGLNPLPAQRPLPIWLGGMSEVAMRRAAHEADGWFPRFDPGPEAEAKLSKFDEYLSEAGRDRGAVGIQNVLRPAGPDPEEGTSRTGTHAGIDVEAWVQRAIEYRDLDTDYLCVETMGCELAPDEHATELARLRDGFQDAGLSLS